jgi:hypothetical protein
MSSSISDALQPVLDGIEMSSDELRRLISTVVINHVHSFGPEKTGAYKRAVQHNPEGVVAGESYSVYLEFGTSKMAARMPLTNAAKFVQSTLPTQKGVIQKIIFGNIRTLE